MPADRKTGKQVSEKSYEVKRGARPSLWRFTVTDFDKRDTKNKPAQSHGHYDTWEECEEERKRAIEELDKRKTLTVAQAIRLYELFKQRVIPKSYELTIQRLTGFFGPVMRTGMLAMNEERLRLLYAGKDGIVNGQAKVIAPGLVHRVVEHVEGCAGHLSVCLTTCRLIAADSHRGYLAEAKTFLRWCMERSYVVSNPDWLDRVKGEGKRRRGGKGKKRLTRSELDLVYVQAYKLIEEGDTIALARQAITGGPMPGLRERATCCLFALLLGVRSQEIRKMRVRDINTRTWSFEVEEDAAKTDDSERSADIPTRLRPYVLRLMEGKSPESYLFGEGDKPRDREWPLQSVQMVCKEAGVRNETAHGLRGAHRDVALEGGATSEMVDRQLGHTSGSDTGAQSYQTGDGTRALKRAKRAAAQAAFDAGNRSRGAV